MTGNDRFLGMLGLARRAGRIVSGTEQVCLEMKKGGNMLVILACDVSANTKKKVLNKTEFYGIPCICPNINGDDIGKAVGRTNSIAAVAVKDENFSKAILNILNDNL